MIPMTLHIHASDSPTPTGGTAVKFRGTLLWAVSFDVTTFVLTVALRRRKAVRAGPVRGIFVVVAEAAGVVANTSGCVGRGDGAGDGACVARVTARHAVALTFV